MGRLLRQELQEEGKQVDITGIWAQVAPAIGLENPEEVPGWEPLADVLREAVAQRATLSATEEVALTAAVMNALPRDEELVEEVMHRGVHTFAADCVVGAATHSGMSGTALVP